MENIQVFKMLFPYLVQLGLGIGAALMVFKIRLIKIESRFDFLQREMTNRLDLQERATDKLEKESKTDYKNLNNKLDNLLVIFGNLEKSVSNIDGYLEGRVKRAEKRLLKRSDKA